MSVVIGIADITKYVGQGGITESTQKVYAADDETECKGAHNAYSIKASGVPTSIKDSLLNLTNVDNIACVVGEGQFTANISNFSASLSLERGDLVLWDVSLNVADNAISE